MVPVPLFGALPGGPELLVIFLVFSVLAVLVPAGIAYWVYRDANARGNDDATLWALGTLLAGVFGSFLAAAAVAVFYALVARE